MYAEERQQAIAELVQRRGRVSVNELAAAYEVTTETVRRDLSTLEELGLVRRVHGGVLPAGSVTLLESRLGDRDQTHIDEKRRIAEAALRFLPESGGTVLLDAGSTTARLAEMFPRDRSLTVLTHAVTVAARLVDHPHVDLHVLPGRVRKTTAAAVGANTVAAISRLRADVAFLGTNGLTVDHGLSTPDSAEAATKAAIVAAAHRTIVLTDSSKIGVERMVRFAGVEDVDVLITDSGIDPDLRSTLEATGLEVVVV